MIGLNPMHTVVMVAYFAVILAILVLTIWALILAIKALRKYLRTPDAQQQRLQPPTPPEID
ncbi:hypothetical protein C5E07_00130 [Pseudoclavibacter sp. RFBJ3]|uniref:hypothetical protein n=1 Tax=unclassified Pseudoclavibacter TaxID=2615177 RepID=UPI000CE7B4D2|nr:MULTISPECIES: hypothetical protein [unclassified Pseudoclavibacter]PPF86397.1 hypothetical protein C5C12_01340 [Pseudoclavibacter sp. RFBJ5]PPF95129.1 hypothetical protein C5E07_00130 [Pseudoclavibacter sp. RFBJ3]PPF97563.1 hypothetical protein C5C19_10810 [Pseudoclavibacter sp. RFBH5]PPG22782.1 hypothetical protein C5E13_11130 [Pseudoclavibacter sp. RFBI4]